MIDVGSLFLVGLDGLDSTGILTRSLAVDDRRVLTSSGTGTAVDTLGLINM